jgi:hypothetical protein
VIDLQREVEALGVDILLNSTVTAVAYGAGSGAAAAAASVTLGGGRMLAAPRVLVTVPLGMH